jgi:hypothetical protein
MVDGNYWGRDAHGKRVLSDDEVRRLLTHRQTRAAGFAERLGSHLDHSEPRPHRPTTGTPPPTSYRSPAGTAGARIPPAAIPTWLR